MLDKEGNFEVIRANCQHNKSSFYNNKGKTTKERNSYTYRKGSPVNGIMQLKIQTCATIL